jgi:hypothetical protein
MAARQPKLWHEVPVPAYQANALLVGIWLGALGGLSCLGYAAFLRLTHQSDMVTQVAIIGMLCLVNAVSCIAVYRRLQKAKHREDAST